MFLIKVIRNHLWMLFLPIFTIIVISPNFHHNCHFNLWHFHIIIYDWLNKYSVRQLCWRLKSMIDGQFSSVVLLSTCLILEMAITRKIVSNWRKKKKWLKTLIYLNKTFVLSGMIFNVFLYLLFKLSSLK